MQGVLSTLDALRERVSVLEGRGTTMGDVENTPIRLPFGIPEIDHLIAGGLLLAEMHEVRCSTARDIASATGFVIGILSGLLRQIEHDKPVFWVSEGKSILDSGCLYPDGLAWFGIDPARIIYVHPLHLQDALWAAGEAACSGGLAATVLHVKGNHKAFDLAVSRKLMLRAQKGEAPLFLLRQAGQNEASSAVTRWHVAPLPSLPDQQFEKGVGHMRLSLTLEKNRNGQTGHWPVAWNPEKRLFQHAAKRVSNPHSHMPFHASSHRSNTQTAAR